MKVGLFIPCYIDQFYPDVAKATYQLLKKLGCELTYPINQTCCGQPMANSGFSNLTKGCDVNFVKNFKGFDYIVCPSGSCVLHIKEHLKDGGTPAELEKIRQSVFELSEFLVDILKINQLNASVLNKAGPGIIECVFHENTLIEPKVEMGLPINDQFPYVSDEEFSWANRFSSIERSISIKSPKN